MVSWLRERSDESRAAVQFVKIVPAAVYASAVRTPVLPNATRVRVDHFYLVKLANDALTKVRRPCHLASVRAPRTRDIDPEWANRRQLLRARERLSNKSFAKMMWNAVVAENPRSHILSARIAKEELRTHGRRQRGPHLTRPQAAPYRHEEVRKREYPALDTPADVKSLNDRIQGDTWSTMHPIPQ